MKTALLTTCLSLFLAAGCGGVYNEDYPSSDRQASGLVIILPGIEGESEYNHEIRQGLIQAGVNGAMPIYCWGRPVPLAGMLLNQMDVIGNRIEGARIAEMVVKYQDAHPGKPVFIVGHSGGGGVAVFAAEAMPEGRKVDGLALLSASISSGYDLTHALEHTNKGILNIYNKDDVSLLGVGTSVMGNVDGMHGPGAGLLGFDKPGTNDSQAKKAAYSKLWQYQMDAADSFDDSHFASTRSGFVSATVGPWILSYQKSPVHHAQVNNPAGDSPKSNAKVGTKVLASDAR